MGWARLVLRLCALRLRGRAQVRAALAAIGLAPGPDLSADQVVNVRRQAEVEARAAVELGPGASEAELHAAQVRKASSWHRSWANFSRL